MTKTTSPGDALYEREAGVCAARGLLMFAYSFPPTNESGAQRPYRFARYLVRHGYRSEVITASGQEKGCPWPHVMEAPAAGKLSWRVKAGSWAGGAVQRVLPYNDLLPWAAEAAAVAETAIRRHRPAAMISTSPPVACHLAALTTKLRFGIPWIADFRDPIRGNPHRSRKISQPYEAMVESLIMRHADAAIANTDSAADAMRKRHPRYAHKIQLIWNGYDPGEPLGPLPVPKRNYRVLLHAGSLYGGRNPGALLRAVSRLVSRGRLNPATARVRLIGWMDMSQPWTCAPEFTGLLVKGCLEYVNEVLPQEQALREMSEADYLLLMDGNAPGIALQVPAKLFQYIRIGRPIFAFTARNSPSERILARSGVAYVAAYQDASHDQMDEYVARLFSFPTAPATPSQWFEEHFNGELQTRLLASVLHTVAD